MCDCQGVSKALQHSSCLGCQQTPNVRRSLSDVHLRPRQDANAEELQVVEFQEGVEQPVERLLAVRDRVAERAFEGLELPLFDLLEPMITEGTDECILCQTISERLGLKGADTAPESW